MAKSAPSFNPRVETLRVPMTAEDFGAVLEAATDEDDAFVRNGLLRLALAWWESAKNEWAWRIEEEG